MRSRLVRYLTNLVLLCLMLGGSMQGQVDERERRASGIANPTLANSPEVAKGESSSNETKIESSPFIGKRDIRNPKIGFDWQGAANQSFFFLAIEHGFRMSQGKTRREFSGPFFEDYRNAVSGLDGWGDTDSVFTNYVAHPMQGAVTGYIQIQNDPGGKKLEFGRDPEYWKSRARATAWAALYSTQFELGPVSEASLGNVGKKRGTMGFVDLVITPVGGFGLILVEDAIDKTFIEGMESRTNGLNRRRLYRMFLNPQRTFANLLGFKKPWHRDTRDIDWSPIDMMAPAPPSATWQKSAAGSN